MFEVPGTNRLSPRESHRDVRAANKSDPPEKWADCIRRSTAVVPDSSVIPSVVSVVLLYSETRTPLNHRINGKLLILTSASMILSTTTFKRSYRERANFRFLWQSRFSYHSLNFRTFATSHYERWKRLSDSDYERESGCRVKDDVS